MQRLEVSGAVRPLYGSLGIKGLRTIEDSNDIHVKKIKTTPVRGKKFKKKKFNNCVKNVSALELLFRGVKIKRQVTAIKSYTSVFYCIVLYVSVLFW